MAQSFERIHRSNLVGMGALPLQFMNDDNVTTPGIVGDKGFDTRGLSDDLAGFLVRSMRASAQS